MSSMGYYPLNLQAMDSSDYKLNICQQPREALVTVDGKEKVRKPVDPPPVIELSVSGRADPFGQFLQSPYYFLNVSLVQEGNSEKNGDPNYQALAGSTVSSLHKLKNNKNEYGGYFVFGDLSIRELGNHRLLFSLFETQKTTGDVTFLASVISAPFPVVTPREWTGLNESTGLSRTFADQGVRLRLRKEPRTLNKGRATLKRSFSNSPHTPHGAMMTQPSVYSRDGYSCDAPNLKRQRSDSEYYPQGYPHHAPSTKHQPSDREYNPHAYPPTTNHLASYLPTDERVPTLKGGNSYMGMQGSYGRISMAPPPNVPYQAGHQGQTQNYTWERDTSAGQPSEPAAQHNFGFSAALKMLPSSAHLYNIPSANNYGLTDSDGYASTMACQLTANQQWFHASAHETGNLSAFNATVPMPPIPQVGFVASQMNGSVSSRGSNTIQPPAHPQQYLGDFSSPPMQLSTLSASIDMRLSGPFQMPTPQYSASEPSPAQLQYRRTPLTMAQIQPGVLMQIAGVSDGTPFSSATLGSESSPLMPDNNPVLGAGLAGHSSAMYIDQQRAYPS